jgi:predicted PurR-regulated permease PerM
MEPVTTQGALSASYTLAISFGVIGFLLVAIATMVARHYINTLNRIEKSLEKIDSRVSALEKFSIETRFNLEKNDDITSRLEKETERIHSEMLSKLRVMQG